MEWPRFNSELKEALRSLYNVYKYQEQKGILFIPEDSSITLNYFYIFILLYLSVYRVCMH